MIGRRVASAGNDVREAVSEGSYRAGALCAKYCHCRTSTSRKGGFCEHLLSTAFNFFVIDLLLGFFYLGGGG